MYTKTIKNHLTVIFYSNSECFSCQFWVWNT